MAKITVVEQSNGYFAEHFQISSSEISFHKRLATSQIAIRKMHGLLTTNKE